MAEYEYKYRASSCSGALRRLKSTWCAAQAESVAAEAAELYYAHCRGGELTWPIVFELWTAEGVAMGRFSVELEAVPSFTATKLAKHGETNG